MSGSTCCEAASRRIGLRGHAWTLFFPPRTLLVRPPRKLARLTHHEFVLGQCSSRRERQLLTTSIIFFSKFIWSVRARLNQRTRSSLERGRSRDTPPPVLGPPRDGSRRASTGRGRSQFQPHAEADADGGPWLWNLMAVIQSSRHHRQHHIPHTPSNPSPERHFCSP